MKLKSVTIQRFRNYYQPQKVEVEEDVTVLIGKNEAGKTTILKALHRLNPANAQDHDFDVTLEYPRWRLARDRKKETLEDIRPIQAEFSIDPPDISKILDATGVPVPSEATVTFSRDYGNRKNAHFDADLKSVLHRLAEAAGMIGSELDQIAMHDSAAAASNWAANHATTLSASGNTEKAKTFTSFVSWVEKASFLWDAEKIGDELSALLWELCPRFFYFSVYETLPGEIDLTELAAKVSSGKKSNLKPGENTMLALLRYAGEEPKDFLDEDYDSRKAELQAASGDLSRRVFEYWKQNPDLEVTFDTDMPVIGKDGQGKEIRHRFLKVELRDSRHGGVETNFSTRSSGFQWFFSFFAAFSEYQESPESLVVLLDEPGTSLHGDAQRDFVRFVAKELGGAKQTIYTTHSQHMIDPSKYEKLRTVDDRATRANPDLGVVVGPVSLSADRDTLLPIESAIGYSISQHLFLGKGPHLAVEGSSDFVYLQRMSEYLVSKGKRGLDLRFSIIPVGGVGNMPAFVALLGRRLKVSALVDGKRSGSTFDRLKNAAEANGISVSAIVVCSDIDGVPQNADLEDLFSTADYLRLFNWAFGTNIQVQGLPNTSEPILRRLEQIQGTQVDHALPAHALTEHRDEFFGSVNQQTVSHFEKLFEKLNSSLA